MGEMKIKKMNAKRTLKLFKRRSVTMNLNVYPENGPDFRDSTDIDSGSTRNDNGNEKQIVKHLLDYYDNKASDDNSENSRSSVATVTVNQIKMKGTPHIALTPTCVICDNKSGRQDNYMILSCNHTFHIYCLAETHFNDVYKFHVIDSEYFCSRKCLVCSNVMQTEELMFLHSKFLNGTKDRIESHNNKIESLETKLRDIKEDLRVCYEYKHKLEHEREKSKQIVATLMTMI